MKKKNIRYGALVVAGVVAVYFGITLYVEKTVQRNIDAEIQKITQFANVRYDDLKLDIIDSRIRLENIIITPRFWNEEIRIEKGTFYEPKTDGNIPSNIRFNLEGIYLNTARSDTFLKSHIESMGFKNAKADLACAVSYNKENRMLDIKQIKLGAGGVGQAELNLRLKNIDPDTIDSLPQNIVLLLITLSGVSIESAEIRYRDEALMDNLIAAAARQKSQSPDEYYQSLIHQLDQAIKNESDPNVKKAISGIREFIMKKDEVSITLAPKKPVPIGKLYWVRDIKPLIDLLGIKIAA